MEPMDDFESLLKGVAGKGNVDPLSEQSVSRIIDERLSESKKLLTSEFIREVLLVLGALFFNVLFLAFNIFQKDSHKPDVTMALNMIYLGGIVYLLTCLFMFVRLIRLSLLQKDTDIRYYVTALYQQTQKTLRLYLWISAITSFVALGGALMYTGMNTYWIVVLAVLLGVGGYYLNRWYIRKRFGKRVDNMKVLMMEFC
ncbi:hypothetical protein [Chitinophaga pinensis]|uniref:Uncharacterized protein n=1 Tax=Chitinophaga pinensis (strain ATCC 43595 / DSM 2588 / LMG 13176 / NBRC 15968 / NCIMB 11800 / UQM 2034) TaxID=485918 RepID=A0A979H071_CHIPD|nr:hypothetical protein [Chitinophaga pinensis]ACU64536.1 hypothetical protein Cpin_7135 [Chitinophaga pinensis DSM 2588]